MGHVPNAGDLTKKLTNERTDRPVASDEDINAQVELPPSHEQGVLDVTANEVGLLYGDGGPPAAANVCMCRDGWRSERSAAFRASGYARTLLELSSPTGSSHCPVFHMEP